METLLATQTRLEAIIKDYCAQPSVNLSVDLSPGSVLSELLIKLSSQLHSQLKTDAELPSTVNTVQTALEAAGDTYSSAIDSVASNYNVIRDTGILVTGRVKVTVAFDRTYYLGAGFQVIHTNLGAVYGTDKSYRVASSLKDDAAAGELQLYKEAAVYYFLLPVAASNTLVKAAAPHNSSLALNSANTSLDGFVEARAFGNFTSGRAQETDRAMISRFQVGLSNKGLVSAQSMQSLLPDVFPELFTQGGTRKAILSVVGASDPELTRGKNAALGITPFGLADVYVRTSDTIQVDAFDATAVCTHAKNGGTLAEWTITLGSSVVGFPAWFYSVVSISYVDDTGATQTTYPKGSSYHASPVTFSAASSPANRLDGGSVDSATVARFTKYQVCTLIAELTGVTNNTPALNDIKPVSVTVSYMPGIGEIQDYMLQSSNRVIAADYLVKAVIPCSLSTSLMLKKHASKSVDTIAIKKDIFGFINSLSFGDPVPVSKLVDICHNYDIQRVDLPVTLTGNLLVPATTPGYSVLVTATDLLSLPFSAALLQYGVSAKTTMFFINYQDIAGREAITITAS